MIALSNLGILLLKSSFELVLSADECIRSGLRPPVDNRQFYLKNHPPVLFIDTLTGKFNTRILEPTHQALSDPLHQVIPKLRIVLKKSS